MENVGRDVSEVAMENAERGNTECRKVRVILWAPPRSLSTAFLRAMTNHSGCQVKFEPFGEAYYYGDERVSKRYKDEEPAPGKTFAEIKEQLESFHPEAELVFIKDLAYQITGRYELLPKGYLHTFLIRDPRKSIPSLYKMATNKDITGWDYFDQAETGFHDIRSLLEYTHQTLGQEMIIIDCDDLLRNPEKVLRLYCEKIGLEYEDSMVNWKHPMPDLSVPEGWPLAFFKTAVESRTFQPPSEKPLPSTEHLPQEVQDRLQECITVYDELYKLRLRAD